MINIFLIFKKKLFVIKIIISILILIYLTSIFFRADLSQLIIEIKKLPICYIFLNFLIIDSIILPIRMYINAEIKLNKNILTSHKEKFNYYVEFVKTSLLTHLPLGVLATDLARVFALKSGVFYGVTKRKKTLIIFYDKITGLVGIAIYFMSVMLYKYSYNLLFIILTVLGGLYIYKKSSFKYNFLCVSILLSIIGIFLNTNIYYEMIKNILSQKVEYINVAYSVPLIILSNAIPLNIIIGMKELTGYLYFVVNGSDSVTAAAMVLILFILDILSKAITVVVSQIISNLYV